MGGEAPRSTPDWLRLARLKRGLLREFCDDGLVRVEWVIAFADPFAFWIWLGTKNDAQRDALASRHDLGERMLQHIEKCGLAGLYEGVTVESQESVDRDHAGKWFYRLR